LLGTQFASVIEMKSVKKYYTDALKKIKTPVLPALLLAGVLITGTIGYSIIWREYNVSIIDALYMTVITITTVGFAEIYPLGSIGRIFTMCVCVLGMGSLFYILSIMMENLFMIQVLNLGGKKKTMKAIDKLSGHIILVGYGRVGQLASREMLRSNREFVVVDQTQPVADTYLQNDKLLFVIGDATEDQTLLSAGIERAGGLIVTTSNAADTVFVVLSAKVLNPKLFVIARCDENSAFEKLRRAGADRIVNPYEIGGQRLANMMIRPHVVDFIETSFGHDNDNLSIENIIISDDSGWIGKTLKEIHLRQKIGASIIAVIRDGKPIANPGGEFTVRSGDRMLALGTREQLSHVEEVSR
jgi:voltage-gated potassium channel